MGKPTICIGENKGADQLRGNCEAYQRLSFRYSDSTIRVGVIEIVIVINCNLITFFKIIENNCNSVFTLITIIEM